MDLFNVRKVKQLEKDKTNLNIELIDSIKIIAAKDKIINEKNDFILIIEKELKNKNVIIKNITLKCEKRELLRRKNACSLGGKATYITKLKSEHAAKVDILNEVIADKDDEILKRDKQISEMAVDLVRANKKIQWLEKNTRAPSFTEINAYDHQQKEVERRQKSRIKSEV